MRHLEGFRIENTVYNDSVFAGASTLSRKYHVTFFLKQTDLLPAMCVVESAMSARPKRCRTQKRKDITPHTARQDKDGSVTLPVYGLTKTCRACNSLATMAASAFFARAK